MAKASIRKAEMADWREAIGRALQRAIYLRGWTLKEFAVAVGRDERQCARWMTGAERAQFDAIFAVDSMRGPFVIALAEQASDIEVITEVRIRSSRKAG
jgi:hypothetical protein